MQKLLILLIIIMTGKTGSGQDAVMTDSFAGKDITITYNIKIAGNKKRSVAETYNGAVKTVYVKGDRVKMRFVSLMRIQNLFYDYTPDDTLQTAVVVKESGKKKYKVTISKSQWLIYNSKYDAAQTVLAEDSLVIAGRVCKKAIITLTNGTKLVAYYLPGSTIEALAAAEPMFAAVPGIVLQYELHHRKKSIIYTAKEINFSTIPQAVVKPPVKGYVNKKFSQGKSVKDELDEEDDDSEDEIINSGKN